VVDAFIIMVLPRMTGIMGNGSGVPYGSSITGDFPHSEPGRILKWVHGTPVIPEFYDSDVFGHQQEILMSFFIKFLFLTPPKK